MTWWHIPLIALCWTFGFVSISVALTPKSRYYISDRAALETFGFLFFGIVLILVGFKLA